MQLTQQTDYALRILMYAAAHPDRLVNITEIAELYGISRSHLTKIVASLASSHYLESIRGNKGGIRLNRPASEINIGELIRRFEPLAIVDCMSKNRTCVITPTCRLKNVFFEATSAFLKTFDQYTLSDMLNPALIEQLNSRIPDKTDYPSLKSFVIQSIDKQN